MSTTTRKVLFAFCAMGLLTMGTLLGGAAGCGGGGSGAAATGDSGGSSDGVAPGVTVDSASDIPSLNIADYYDLGASASQSALVAKNKHAVGESCKEFCYQRQCLVETIRHSKEAELVTCMIKAVPEATDGAVDLPDSGCIYISMIPPDFLSSEDDTTAKIRLCKNGTSITFHRCDGGSLVQELLLTDSGTGTVTGTSTNVFGFQGSDGDEGCEDRSQMTISSNCSVANFTDPDCLANFNGKFSGCFGSGTINFSVTGGASGDRNYTLESNFTAGGEGEDQFGSFSFCGFADWTAGGNGCFKADSLGTFPAIPTSEVTFLSELEPCSAVVSSNPSFLCPNDAFDPEEFEEAFAICPFRPASGSTCPFDFENTDCCSISGDTIATQRGTRIDSSTVSSLFTSVSNHACPEQSSTINFSDSWTCTPESGASFTELDLSVVDQSLFSECAEIFADLDSPPSGEDNCEEQGLEEEADNLNDLEEASTACTSDSNCATGEICASDGSTGICVDAPTSCTSDSDCGTGENCINQPEIGGTVCVPTFACEDDFACPLGQSCNETSGECEFSEEE